MTRRRHSLTSAAMTALCVVTFAAGISGQSQEVWRASFDRPVRLPAVTLPAGAYTFTRMANFSEPTFTVRDDHGKVVTLIKARVVKPTEPLIKVVTVQPARPGTVPQVSILNGVSESYELIYAHPQAGADEQRAGVETPPASAKQTR
jgi:hypothetical protein